jgi:hypothetical protein
MRCPTTRWWPVPSRIKLRRTAGWRKPANTVVVSRPGKWGNPYNAANTPTIGYDEGQAYTLSDRERRAVSVELFKTVVDRDGEGEHRYPDREEIIRELAGRNLGCWCDVVDAEGMIGPCHADILMEIANSERQPWLDHVGADLLGRLTVQHDEPVVGPATAGALFGTDGAGRHGYRYALTRRWGLAPAAVFVMLNPSTATASSDDPTISRCVGFARSWGCGGIAVINLFGLRATDPRQLAASADPVGPDNDAVALAVLAAVPSRIVVAAWGADRSVRTAGRAERMLELITGTGVGVHCLGVTREGFPRHPLYLSRASRLERFSG